MVIEQELKTFKCVLFWGCASTYHFTGNKISCAIPLLFSLNISLCFLEVWTILTCVFLRFVFSWGLPQGPYSAQKFADAVRYRCELFVKSVRTQNRCLLFCSKFVDIVERVRSEVKVIGAYSANIAKITKKSSLITIILGKICGFWEITWFSTASYNCCSIQVLKNLTFLNFLWTTTIADLGSAAITIFEYIKTRKIVIKV